MSSCVLEPRHAEIDVAAALRSLAEQGYARLGRLVTEEGLVAMRARAEDIMQGRVVHEGLFFQADSASGAYADLPYGRGWEGPSLHYRKIEKLEKDPVFRAWMTNALFRRITLSAIGEHVTLFRAVLWTKAAHGGTELPWHQDGGRFWGVDRDPTFQAWTALDDATTESGCMYVVPGSHAGGLVTPDGGVIPAHHLERGEAGARAIPLPALAGEVILLHNHTWHRSGRNTTDHPRRAFSICLMDASTRCTRKRGTPRTFPTVFGPVPSTTTP